MTTATVPAWYATDVTHSLRDVWRQGVSDKTLARAYNAYLAAAPSPDDYRPEPAPDVWPDSLLTAFVHVPA